MKVRLFFQGMKKKFCTLYLINSRYVFIKGIVNRILNTIQPQPMPDRSEKELYENMLMADPEIVSGEKFVDYAHKVIFVGGDKLVRKSIINGLVNVEGSECYRLREERDNIGFMEYLWNPFQNDPNETKAGVALKILDISQDVSETSFCHNEKRNGCSIFIRFSFFSYRYLQGFFSRKEQHMFYSGTLQKRFKRIHMYQMKMKMMRILQ